MRWPICIYRTLLWIRVSEELAAESPRIEIIKSPHACLDYYLGSFILMFSVLFFYYPVDYQVSKDCGDPLPRTVEQYRSYVWI